MTKQELDKYLVEIGGLIRTYRADKGLVLESGWVGEGWNGIIKNLIEELVQLGWDRRINQIKEKFGGLRFYIENIPAGGEDIISKYERLSYTICEKCGESGVIRKNRDWIKTLCDKHENYQNQLN